MRSPQHDGASQEHLRFPEFRSDREGSDRWQERRAGRDAGDSPVSARWCRY